MIHPCKSCAYAYFDKVKNNKVFYNALSDEYDHETITKDAPCCGCMPGGQVVDHGQPKCKEYKQND